MARRRVVVVASGLGILSAISAGLEHAVREWLRVPAAWIVLPMVFLEGVALVFVVKAMLGLKAEEARQAGADGSRNA